MNHHPLGRILHPAVLHIYFCTLLGGCSARPVETELFVKEHEKTQAAQPRGVTIELKLPKTRFYQGEIVPATLVFPKTLPEQCEYWVASDHGWSRPPDVGFRAISEGGEPVLDPLRYPLVRVEDYQRGQKLGRINLPEIGLTINRWLRFDRPGIYRLYAWSRRLVEGKDAKVSGFSIPAETVSPIVTVQIDPLTPAREKEILGTAAKDLDARDETKRHEAFERLRFLQTPSAREMLMPHLGDWRVFEPFHALEEALDRQAGGKRMSEAVSAGRVPISMSMLQSSWFYRYFDETRGDPVPATTKEVLEAAKTSLREQPWNDVTRQNALTLFLEERSSGFWMGGSLFFPSEIDPKMRAKDPQLRATLAEHQLELSDAQSYELIMGEWSAEEQRLFLPLIRRQANAPADSPKALELLARLAPEEARQLIVDDILHPPLRHARWNEFDKATFQLHPLLCLPVGTVLPEVQEALRHRLAHPSDTSREDSLETAFALAAHYGSPELLEDVRQAYQSSKSRLIFDGHETPLRFLLRYDSPAGVKALREAIAAQINRQHYTPMVVLKQQWSDLALPLVLEALDDNSAHVCITAAELLASHAIDPLPIEQLVKTAERLNSPPYLKTAQERQGGPTAATWVMEPALQNERWHFTRAQLQRLLAISEERTTARTLIEKRLAAAGK